VGRLVADPESRATVEGQAVSKFKLAVTRPGIGQGEANTDFIDIVAWGKLAEVCTQYLKKGKLTLVDGRIQNRSFEDQSGQRRWVTEVIARSMTMLDRAATEKVPAEMATENISATAEEVVDDTELEGDLPF